MSFFLFVCIFVSIQIFPLHSAVSSFFCCCCVHSMLPILLFWLQCVVFRCCNFRCYRFVMCEMLYNFNSFIDRYRAIGWFLWCGKMTSVCVYAFSIWFIYLPYHCDWFLFAFWFLLIAVHELHTQTKYKTKSGVLLCVELLVIVFSFLGIDWCCCTFQVNFTPLPIFIYDGHLVCLK